MWTDLTVDTEIGPQTAVYVQIQSDNLLGNGPRQYDHSISRFKAGDFLFPFLWVFISLKKGKKEDEIKTTQQASVQSQGSRCSQQNAGGPFSSASPGSL